jgi:hypothetical protein
VSVVSVWRVPLRGSATAERELSHTALRLILAAVTGYDPHAIRFATGYRGKPYLADLPRAPHFSLSRSGDIALIAVTWDGPVGVDVERIRPDLEIAAFVRDLVGAGEVARIEAMPHERRERAWFQAWTRLEAVAKASGPTPRRRGQGRTLRFLGTLSSTQRTWAPSQFSRPRSPSSTRDAELPLRRGV